jgi:flagellar hook-associated protein FlgK
MNLVMPDANTLAGVNVTNAEITPFGQYVLNQLTLSANDDLQKFITATGFDPRRDVTEVLAATSGSLDKQTGLVMALGNFNVDQLTAAITAKSSGVSTQDYGGARLILGELKDQHQDAVAFLGSTIAIVGDAASVKAAIDRSSHANSINPALATQVQSLSLNNDAWAVTTNSITALLPGLAGAPGTPAPGGAAGLSQMAQMFKGIVGSNGGVKFGDMVTITGQAVTVDAQTAKSLADVVQAIASIAAMAGAGNDPNIAALAQLMQGLKVTADGVNVNITLSVPEAQLEAVINQMKKPRVAPAARPGVKPAMRVMPARVVAPRMIAAK